MAGVPIEIVQRAGDARPLACFPPLPGGSAVPPSGKINLILTTDISGSMDSLISTAESEVARLTRLDLAKHCLRVVVNMVADINKKLGGDPAAMHEIGLVTFSTAAQVAAPMQPVNAGTKSKLEALITRMETESTTNLYAGIRCALNLAAESGAFANGGTTHIVVLTDGDATISPPEGDVAALQRMLRSRDLVPQESERNLVISMLGFSPEVKSQTLHTLAQTGGGLFSYISDANMMGTAVINLMASIFTSVPAKLTIARGGGAAAHEADVLNLWPFRPDFGRWLPLPHAVRPDDSYTLTIAGSQVTGRCGEIMRGGDARPVAAAVQQFADTLDAAIRGKNIRDRMAPIAAWEATVGGGVDGGASGEDGELVNALLALTIKPGSDLASSGQIAMGLSEEFFTTWGAHYARAVQSAITLQHPLNFKDAIFVAMAKTEKYGDLQQAMYDLFSGIPPPKPTGFVFEEASAAAVAAQQHALDMSSLISPYSGCFAADTMIQMMRDEAETTLLPISMLRRGMAVALPKGGSAIVRALVIQRSGRREPYPMCALDPIEAGASPLVISPYHPVHVAGDWQFPIAITAPNTTCDTVYNLVLESGHMIMANGRPCITLGHGMTDGVLEHEYFGTDAVVRDLAKHPGWMAGCVDVTEPMMERGVDGRVKRVHWM